MAKQVKVSTILKRESKGSDGRYTSVDDILARHTRKPTLADLNRQNYEKAMEVNNSQREARLQAIELAKSNGVKANAGDNRTTASVSPVKNVSNPYGLPVYKGLNTAENGADVDTDFKTEASTKNGYKGLNAFKETAVGKQILGNGITEEESLKHASEVMKPYENNKKAMAILDEYVAKENEQTRSMFGRFESGMSYSGVFDKLANEFMEETGASIDEFRQIAANYSQLKNKQLRKEQQQEYKEMSTGERIAKSILKAPSNVLGSYQGLVGNFQTSADPNLGRDYNSAFYKLSNENTDIRAAQNEEIENIENPVARTLAHFGYNASVMGVESATAALTGEAGLASFFAGGYTSALQDAENRGLSGEQSQAYALAVGGLEYLTERIPWEGLKNIYAGKAVSKDAVKGSIMPYIKALLKQSGSEAAEEVINGIGETIADGLISGDKSNLNNAIQSYMQEGMDESEATRKAIWDVVKQTADAAITAAISAGTSAGPALASEAYNVTKAGRNLANFENKTGNLTRNVENPNYISENREDYETDEAYEKAQATRQAILNASEKVAKKERLSGKEARSLYESYAETEETRRKANIQRAKQVFEEAKTKAEEKVVEKIKEASTPSEIETLKEEHIESQKVQEAVAEKKAELIEQGKATERDFEEAITPTKAVAMAENGETIAPEVLEKLPEKVKQAYETGNANQANKLTSDASKIDIGTVKYTNSDGDTAQTEIKSVSQNNSGELVLELSNGKTVKAAEAEFTDKGKYIYNSPNGINSLDNPVLAQIAFDIEKNSKHGVAIGYVTNSLKDMYTIGASGLSFDEAIKSKKYDLSTLGKEKLREAYEEGKKHSEATSRATSAKRGSGLIKEATAENAEAYKRQFADEATQNEYENQLSEANKSFLELFSRKIGVDIAFFNENSQDRGSYRPDEGKIYLNLYHSHNMFNVALHEGIGEFMAASNEKAYNAIVDSVLNAYAATNSTKLAKDIRAYQSAYEGDTYGGTYRGAAQELFNDALSDMFSSEENMQKLYNWMVENEGEKQANKVKKTLADYFKSVAETIKEVITEGRLSKAEVRQLRISEKEANTYVDQILKAMDKAIANRDAGVVQQGKSAPRMSMKVSFADIVDEIANETFDYSSYVPIREDLPSVYVEYAKMVDAPVIMSYQKARISMDKEGNLSDHYHNLGKGIMKKLPEAMEKPELIFVAPNGRINALLNLKDKQKRKILISLETDEGKYINKKYAKYNKDEQTILITAFGAEKKYLNWLLEQSEILYPIEKAPSDVQKGSMRANPSNKGAISDLSISSESEDATTKQPKSAETIVKNAQKSGHKSINVNVPVSANDDLVAIHNTTADQLLETIKLGGFPSPSIAIVKADMGHEKYGEVSVVFGRETVDPEYIKANNIYGGDAWTAVVPTIEFEVNDNKIKEIRQYLDDSLPADLRQLGGYDALDSQNSAEALRRGDIINSHYAKDPKFRYLFVTSKDGLNQKVEIPKKVSTGVSYFEPEQVKAIAETIGRDTLEEAVDSSDKAIKLQDTIIETLNNLKYNKYMEEHTEEEFNALPAFKQNFLKNFYKKDKWSLTRTENLLHDALEYLNNGGFLEVNDENALRDELDKIVEENIDKYNDWIVKLFDGVFLRQGIRNDKNAYTDSGKARSWEELHEDVTLDNIVKVMNSQSDQGATGLFSQSVIQALATKRFKSIDEMKASINQLKMMNDEEYKAEKNKFFDQYQDIINDIYNKNHYNDMIAREEASNVIAEVLQVGRSEEVIDRELRKYDYLNIKKDTAKKISKLINDMAEMATGYFEAKPKRAVNFDEILNVITPDTKTELIDALKENNIPYETYEEGNEQARKIAVNNTAGARFSIGGIGAQNADMMSLTEADDMRIDGKSMEEIFAKTGWYLGNDDKWRFEINNKNAKIYTNGAAKVIDTPEYQEYLQQIDIINTGEVNEEWMDAYTKSLEYSKKNNIGNKEHYLDEILKHDELFEAYPSLARIKVRFEKMDGSTNGRYIAKENAIELNKSLKLGEYNLKRTLFHEIQHAIQRYEGFANGASPDWWALRGTPEVITEEATKAYEDAKKELEDIRAKLPKEFVAKYDRYAKLLAEYGGLVENWTYNTAADKLYEELKAENEEALQQLDDATFEADLKFPIGWPMLPSEAYLATAGEIEAREVADRVDMTDEERKANLPKMTDDKGRVVFAENATTPWRYPTGDDIRFSKEVNSDGEALSVAQQDLFNNSKAVDKNGKLLVLYHGSQSAEKFNTFDMNVKGAVNGRAFGDGYYFTPYEQIAKSWGDKNIYKVYLNITKPYYANKTNNVPADVKKLIRNRYEQAYENDHAFINARLAYISEVKNAYDALEVLNRYNMLDAIKSLGYDGIIYDKPEDKDVVQYVAFYPEQIKRTDNYNPTVDSLDIRKSIDVKFDEDTIDIPARTYDDMVYFLGTDEEMEAAERADMEVMNYYAEIIRSKGFNGLMFSWKDEWNSGTRIQTRYVTRSTREGEDWHLSEALDNVPMGHQWYNNKNDNIKLYSHDGHDLESLYSDLLSNTPKEGVKVYVLREQAASSARYSKTVFGEESQYSSQLEQTQFVSQVLSTLNNQLKGTTVSMKYIDDTVKYILDKYDANLNADDFKMELSQFIAYMTANEQIDYNQMMNYLLNIGDEVIQASQLKDPEEERIYQELKKELSSHNINLTEVERKELISKYGGSWNAVFGKLNAAGIKLNNAGQHMDGSTYSEIVDKFREIAGVQLDEEKTAVDQIATILDAMDVLKPSAYQWEGATDMDKALDVATTIIDRYYSMATAIKEANIVKGTEKGAAAVERAKKNEIKKLRAKQEEYKLKVNEEFRQLVEDRKKVIEEQQAFYKRQAEIEKNFTGEKRDFYRKKNMSQKELEKTAKMQAQVAYQGLKDTEAKRKNKDNIVRTCTRLINWMNKPTDTRHVPTFLKPALTDMIKSINFMPASMRKGEDGTISAMKWQESMRKLQSVIASISSADAESMNDSDKYELALVMEVDEIVARMEKLLTKYSGTADISRMSAEDLKTLSDIMKSISESISHMNENFMNRRFKHVSEAAVAAINEMNELRPMSSTKGAIGDFSEDFLNLSMAEPITFFEELGSVSESIMQEFFDGEKIGIQIIQEADNMFTSLKEKFNLTEKELRSWENDVKDYTIDGVTLSLTSADLMSLYCSYNREMLDQQERPFEATHHIAAGGIKGFRRKIVNKKGIKVVNRNPQVAHVNQAEVLRLLDNLTETQKQYADAVVNYMSTTLAEHGNVTSNKLNGYSKFLGKYYFPLKTDTNAIATNESNNTAGMAKFLSLVFPSFTKSQVDKADNALVIMDFFNVVTEHIKGMSNYCAYAMPVSDAMRWYNYAETERNNTEVEDQYFRTTRSIKGAMDRVHGDKARNYFEDFIRDVNLDSAITGDKNAQIIQQALTGFAKAKAVGLNTRVVLQQPAAIIRAGDVIERKYLMQGWFKMLKHPFKACDYAQSKNYLCYWKSKGFSDTRVSQGLKEIITGLASKRQDIVEKTGILAGIADDVTWASMYYAAENKIEATTDLMRGTEEFETAVEELFSNIINHTQVIDSNLRKTATMRSQRELTMLANAFKKEPQKTYNMLHRARWNQIQANYSGDPEKIKAANKAMRHTFTIFVENAFVTAIAQSLVDAWRDDDDEDGYLIKMLHKMIPWESYEAIQAFVEELNKDPDDRKNIYKLVASLITGVYGGAGNILDNMNPLSWMPFISEFNSLLQGYQVSRLDDTAALKQLKDSVDKFSSSTATTYSKLYALAQVIGYFTGVGADNALKDLRGIYNQFLSDKTGYRIEKSTTAEKQNAKKKETERVSEVFEKNDLSLMKSEITSTYNKAIADGKDESNAWKAARDMLKEQYKIMIEAHPEDKVSINNKFTTLLKYTKQSNGNGGMRALTDKEIQNKLESWANIE